jgi:hypothetical protein
MAYFVSMQQSDLPFSFTHVFSKSDADSILNAKEGIRVDLDEAAFGTLFEDGDFVITMRSPGGGQRLYSLNFSALCDHLSNHPEDDAE